MSNELTRNHPSNPRWHPGFDPYLDTHDAVPRDGPAVFVGDTRYWDSGQGFRGVWLDALAPVETFVALITDLTGQPPHLGEWAILDQVGFDSTMVDEQPEILRLDNLAVLDLIEEPVG